MSIVVFAGPKLFGGEILVQQTQSLLQPTVACQSVQLVQDMVTLKEEERWLFSFTLPSLHLLLVILLPLPPPHIVQNHVDLLNRSVKLIIP